MLVGAIESDRRLVTPLWKGVIHMDELLFLKALLALLNEAKTITITIKK